MRPGASCRVPGRKKDRPPVCCSIPPVAAGLVPPGRQGFPRSRPAASELFPETAGNPACLSSSRSRFAVRYTRWITPAGTETSPLRAFKGHFAQQQLPEGQRLFRLFNIKRLTNQRLSCVHGIPLHAQTEVPQLVVVIIVVAFHKSLLQRVIYGLVIREIVLQSLLHSLPALLTHGSGGLHRVHRQLGPDFGLQLPDTAVQEHAPLHPGWRPSVLTGFSGRDHFTLQHAGRVHCTGHTASSASWLFPQKSVFLNPQPNTPA